MIDKKELEALKNRLTQFAGKKTKVYEKRTLTLEEGENQIRLLPLPKRSIPILEYYFHYGIGKATSIFCPKLNNDQECPICDWAEDMRKDNFELAKKLFATRRFFTPVVNRKEPKKVYWWGYSKTICEEIIAKYEHKDYGDLLWNPESGLDMTIVSVPAEKSPTKRPQVKIAAIDRKESPLGNPTQIEELLNAIPKMPEDVYKMREVKEIKDLLTNWLNPPEEAPAATKNPDEKSAGVAETENWEEQLDKELGL